VVTTVKVWSVIRYVDVLTYIGRQYLVVQIHLVKDVNLPFSFKHLVG